MSACSTLATPESVSNGSNLWDIWSNFSNSSTVPDAASSHAQIEDWSGDGHSRLELLLYVLHEEMYGATEHVQSSGALGWN